uniref:Uncharacterized protein n=1 Tax=Solanum tuberosum TaxID=4113 RepID=M1AY28_SOLTU
MGVVVADDMPITMVILVVVMDLRENYSYHVDMLLQRFHRVVLVLVDKACFSADESCQGPLKNDSTLYGKYYYY